MFRGKKLRLGLCCTFQKEPISFTHRKASFIRNKSRKDQYDLISTTVLHNCTSLLKAVEYCAQNSIGAFRVNSRFLPLKSHPELGYNLQDLPDYELISALMAECKKFCRERNIRLSFHPDQFTLLSSPRKNVTSQSIDELIYHAELAERIGADVIIIHAGGAYGDKDNSIKRLISRIDNLPDIVRRYLAIENDDKVYTPSDLFKVCDAALIPLIYDVHHHRCLPDGLDIEETTGRALKTWNREPLFHVSSPKGGWGANDLRAHHEYIDCADFPKIWNQLELTVDVEAKGKELAVAKLQKELVLLDKVA